MDNVKKIAILTSGGDAPGMNAAIRGIVRTASFFDIAVLGCLDGFQGMYENHFIQLNNKSVANCISHGGTLLHTKRFPEFKQQSVRQHALNNLKENKVDAIIILGGNGSFQAAHFLHTEGDFKVIGIPCTIDNDIVGTNYTIGFDTARNTALDAIDKIRDTVLSLNRHFIVEVMGRSSGFLAVDVGVAGGAELIIIPEYPLSVEQIVTAIKKRPHNKRGSIIVVAEADQPGRSVAISEQIKELADINYHVCILGHTQRGGSPSVRDRKFATIMGAKAVSALRDNQEYCMLAVISNEVVTKDFPDPNNCTRFFNDTELLDLQNIICNYKNN